MDKACKRWCQSKRTMYGKITHMKSGQGAPHLMDRQNWHNKNFEILNTPIIHQHSSKSALKSTHEATVSRLRSAGPSAEESDQVSVKEPGTMKSISVGSTH